MEVTVHKFNGLCVSALWS